MAARAKTKLATDRGTPLALDPGQQSFVVECFRPGE